MIGGVSLFSNDPVMTNSNPNAPERDLQTRIVQLEGPITPGFASFSVPIARASTVVFPDLASMRSLVWSDDSKWRYGLHGTPTTIGSVSRPSKAAKYALLQPSGLAAISNVYFGLIKSGDHVLVPDNVYGPNRDHADWLTADFGLEVTYYYGPMIGAGIGQTV